MMLNNNNPIVLVVDDSPDSLGMINTALNQAGYTVLVALNGKQALSIVEQIQPDVVLMDAVMPVIDGFECCIQVRQILPLTPIIFMTGLSDVEHTVKAFKCGGNDYITKPIKPEELLARITSHITSANMINNARNALDSAKQHVMAVDADGQILWATSEAKDLLNKGNFNDEANSTELYSTIKSWLKSNNTKNDLILRSALYPLTIRYFKYVNANEHLLRILNNETILDSTVLEKALCITKREAEVLLWVAQGKTNKEIGDILSLSPRTVNKHLEQLYPKIQVDNRTAATSIAIQALMGLPV